MLVRLIAAKWAKEQGLAPDVIEGDFTFDEILEKNVQGYNAYEWPNHPSPETYSQLPVNPRTGQKRWIKGSDVNVFQWVFADMDLKDYRSSEPSRRHDYATKEAFLEKIYSLDVPPTRVVDSGGGIHVYWKVIDLDAKSFLRLNRRLSAFLHTDPAVSTLNQLMRVPNTVNVKDPDNPRPAEIIYEDEAAYTAEQLDQWLPPIAPEDEQYCVRHYDQCYQIGTAKLQAAELPKRFLEMSKHDKEIEDLYFGTHKDRSTADFRLGLVLFNRGFSREDATAILSRTSKAADRTAGHAYSYGANIVEKIWSEEAAKVEEKKKLIGNLPMETIADIPDDTDPLGDRIYCHPMIDATARGFRLTDVFGLIGGQGNGKSTNALNIMRWFSEYNINKDYIHAFVSLEMPKKQIRDRWRKMSSELKRVRPEIDWDRTVYVLDNFNDDGTYRELGLDEIQEWVLALEKSTGKKVGCLVVDHIGILKQNKGKGSGDFGGLIGVCKQLKAVAMRTKTFFIIQSQTSRGKNGGGDRELDLDAAFGTSEFENFADFIMPTWQPLKRVVKDMEKGKELFVTAFKMAKIREKDQINDRITEGQVYGMVYDPRTALLREMTSDEHKAYAYWNKKAKLAQDRAAKREPSEIAVITWTPKKRDPGKDAA